MQTRNYRWYYKSLSVTPARRPTANRYLSLFFVQYLDVARALEGYGVVTFPHCECDARRNGHVITSVKMKHFRLQACSNDGDIEVSLTIFRPLGRGEVPYANL